MVYPNKAQCPQFPTPLARQSSLYNLTFHEVQSQLGNVGKPLNCMNLDELLRNIIWLEEEGQIVQNPSSSSSSASFFLENLNLNGTLSKKTVDEVWKDIVNEVDNQSIKQKSTLGETTLEKFLVCAGVVNCRPIMGIDPMSVMVSQQTDSLQFQIAAIQQEQEMAVLDSNIDFSDQLVYENPVVDIGYFDNQLGMSMPIPKIELLSSGPTTSDSHRHEHKVVDVTLRV